MTLSKADLQTIWDALVQCELMAHDLMAIETAGLATGYKKGSPATIHKLAKKALAIVQKLDTGDGM